MIAIAIMLTIAAFISITMAFTMRKTMHSMKFNSIAFLLVVAAIISYGFTAVAAVPAGNVGVPVIFGQVQTQVLHEGLNMKNPFAEIIPMSIRTETYTMSAVMEEGQQHRNDSIVALSKDGLYMPLDVTVAYRLVPSDAPWVYRNLGGDYVEKIVRPASRTAVREAVSKYSSHEAYSTKRNELTLKIQEELQASIAGLMGKYSDFKGQGFEIQQVMLRNVDLPEKVKTAIEHKLEAEQQSLQMKYVLEKEQQEAERKRIEARGIADFQDIVTKGINENLLKWKGIEATNNLSKSPNAKIIIIGSGKDGLPVILNASDK